MTQGMLPIKYEEEPTASKATALAGLPLYLDLFHALGLPDHIDRTMGIRADTQGWPDSQMIQSLLLLNLAGGDHVADLDVLNDDAGFAAVLRHVAYLGLPRKERRRFIRLWRKGKARAVPSPSSTFRYLEAFHDPRQEELRLPGKAFIPAPNTQLQALMNIIPHILDKTQLKHPQAQATLDMDATLIESSKKEAYPCYKGFKAYQPLTVYWQEQDQIVFSEFRDGNVPAGYNLKEVLIKSLENLPAGVNEVFLRSDSAGYVWDLLRYCAEGKNERFGVIQFAISVDVTKDLRRAVAETDESEWHPLIKMIDGEPRDTGEEWAEVCFVPNALTTKKYGPEYRFVAVRKALTEQFVLPECDQQLSLPIQSVEMGSDDQKKRYKIAVIVTNRTIPGDALIWWSRKRCGNGEKVHSISKNDLAGGTLPSGLFGANAAWWTIAVISYNFNTMMKRLVLKEEFFSYRLKAIRFHVINRAGRVIEHARQIIVRVNRAFYQFIFEARRKIKDLFLPHVRGSPAWYNRQTAKNSQRTE